MADRHLVNIETIPTIAELRNRLDRSRAAGAVVGFVPTMGFLHKGHASLMQAARRENDVVVASIFVNPLQFAAGEDLSDYPRDLEQDTDLAASAGVDLLFVPGVEEMYPSGPVLTTVSVDALATSWEGATRPTHFAGVATVVTKLLSIVGPCQAYFGEKDFQQLAVVRRLVADLSLPVDVRGCPIVREPDGLAMSSRNVYLAPDERVAATVLRRALDDGLAAIADGEISGPAIRRIMTDVVGAEPLAELDYASIVNASTLEELDQIDQGDEDFRLIVAARVGRPRLIDNAGATI